MSRLLAVGDIHGCANTLKALMSRVKPTEEDQVVFLGDFCDRGNGVIETIDFMIDLKNRLPKTIFLKGNHEDLFLRYLLNGPEINKKDYILNGGGITLFDYTRLLGKMLPEGLDDFELEFHELPKRHQNFYNELKLFHVEGGCIFVHAGLRHNVPLEGQHEDDVLWLRETFMYNPINTWGGKTIVHGHTPMKVPDAVRYHQKYPDRYDVDNGCVFGYDLTCLDLYSKVTWKQKLIDERLE
jgi:serine/threonine protein phosphatase 1